ncbi:MAG: YjbF family lipoprotein [Paracoccaceae bacterium]
MTRLFTAFGALVILGACSSAGGVNPVFRAVWDRVSPGQAEPETAQTATAAPALTRARIDELNIAMIRVKVGAAASGSILTARTLNGGYATYSSSNQQTITLFNALVTAHRGIGFDLLAVAHAPNDPLAVRTPLDDWPSAVRRDYRLSGTGPDGTVLSVNCAFRIGPPFPITQVEITYETRIVQESCTGDATFQNLHMVEKDGHVWRTAQWVGPQMDQFEIEILEPLD